MTFTFFELQKYYSTIAVLKRTCLGLFILTCYKKAFTILLFLSLMYDLIRANYVCLPSWLMQQIPEQNSKRKKKKRLQISCWILEPRFDLQVHSSFQGFNLRDHQKLDCGKKKKLIIEAKMSYIKNKGLRVVWDTMQRLSSHFLFQSRIKCTQCFQRWFLALRNLHSWIHFLCFLFSHTRCNVEFSFIEQLYL